MFSRVLTRTQAARYCGMSPRVFERECPIPPLDCSGRGDRRLFRWDRRQLDQWIDRLTGRSGGLLEGDWLDRVGQ